MRIKRFYLLYGNYPCRFKKILFDDKQQNKSGRKFYSSDSFFEFDLTFRFDWGSISKQHPFNYWVSLGAFFHHHPDHLAIILLGVSRALNGKHHNGHLDRTPFVGGGQALISPPFGVLQTINVRGTIPHRKSRRNVTLCRVRDQWDYLILGRRKLETNWN
ncbi:hypothetical protein CDAR_227411 [Caerostris darwini]|uniref:Uncharacterized protein n=1 Tax=Caerostris darwini TaxID=1538125 RepID=A0AAV4ULP2_9ARAC|nr:hypothetical protein CDAR_227411 [Caerostris darwini]